MLKGNLEKVVQHGKRADSIVKNMLLHSRAGLRRASAGRHQCGRRGEPQSRLSRRARRDAGLQHHARARPRPGRRRWSIVYPQEITRVLLNLISNGFYAATKRKDEARRRLRADAERCDQEPRRQGRDPDPRQRHRHSAGGEGEDVQSLLHDQAGRRGHRARPVAQPRHRRETARRHDRRRHRARRVHRIQDRAAARQPASLAIPEARREPSTSWSSTTSPTSRRCSASSSGATCAPAASRWNSRCRRPMRSRLAAEVRDPR